MTFFTVGPPPCTSRPSAVTKPHLEHAVAQRSVAQPAVPGEPAASTPPTVAAGVARVERALLAVLGRAPRRARRTVVPAPTVTVISAGS